MPFLRGGAGGGVAELPLTTASNLLGGDVTMTNTNQDYDGPSVSLAAGTWFVCGSVLVALDVDSDFVAKIWDGTTIAAAGQQRVRGVAAQCTLAAIVSPGSTTTYKVSVSHNSATTKTLKAAGFASNTVATGNKVSWIFAVRIG